MFVVIVPSEQYGYGFRVLNSYCFCVHFEIIVKVEGGSRVLL